MYLLGRYAPFPGHALFAARSELFSGMQRASPLPFLFSLTSSTWYLTMGIRMTYHLLSVNFTERCCQWEDGACHLILFI